MNSAFAAGVDDAGRGEDRIARQTVLIVVGLVALRIVAAIFTPLMCDEAYYWVWSRHLTAGYYDHPPLVAFVIRLGTLIVGHNELGVRLISILLALPMSWAVYRSTAILFGNPRASATAAILLNVTMMVAAGTFLVSPDAPLMLSASFVMLSLAKVIQSGQGPWWLAVGASVGVALISKYSGLFFGPAILIWLLVVPELRRWLISPWPYLGALVAFTLFLPTLIWVAAHEWGSFAFQFERVSVYEFKPRFLWELLGGQILLATPAVFLLGASGHHALLKGAAGTRAAATLINALVLPVVAYFTFHALHGTVHPNWLAPIYPAFAVAAAVAAHLVRWRSRWQRILDFQVRWGLLASVIMFALMILQLNTGLLSGYRREQSGVIFANGFGAVANDIENIRKQTGSTCILASDFGTTAWLAFYLPDSCVRQRGDRQRWSSEPELSAQQRQGKLLFVGVDQPFHDFNYHLGDSFSSSKSLARLERRRGPTLMQTYDVILTEGASDDVLSWKAPDE